jgi:hypothetical protein
MKVGDDAGDTSLVGQVSDLPQEVGDVDGRSETCPTSGHAHPTHSRLWLWIVAAFVVQALAWAAWFAIASLHPVEEVPVIRAQAR